MLLFALLCLAGRPDAARAQEVPAAYGLIAGTAAGVYVTTGIFVARARAGSYIYSLEDVIGPRWELIPAVAMPVGGLLVGAENGQRLASSLVWGGAGFVAGAAVGLGMGELLGDTSQGRWGGLIIGSAAGLLAGTIYGAVTYDPPETFAPHDGSPRPRAPASIVIRLPL